jgi:hypothetical protein
LTANLQLQHGHSVPRAAFGGEPERCRDRTRRGPGGASIESSSALRLPAAAFSSAHRACSVASDALCRDTPERDPTLRSSPPSEAARPVSIAVSSKTTTSSVPGRLPSTSARSSAPALAVHAACATRPTFPGRGFRLCPSTAGLHQPSRLTPDSKVRDHCEPATAPAVSPPRTGFRRPFTTRARGWMARPDRVNVRTRRLSSTSATRTTHEHNHGSTDPRFVHRQRGEPSLR